MQHIEYIEAFLLGKCQLNLMPCDRMPSGRAETVPILLSCPGLACSAEDMRQQRVLVQLVELMHALAAPEHIRI